MANKLPFILFLYGLCLFIGGLTQSSQNDIMGYRRDGPLKWYQHGRLYIAIGVFLISMAIVAIPS